MFVREVSLFMGCGQLNAEIAITLANHLIFASFLQSVLLGPKESNIMDGLKSFAPPNDASEIFRPPPLTKKLKVPQIP